MKKFDELEYWLNLNEYLKTALGLIGLSIAIFGLIFLIDDPLFNILSIIILILLIALLIMQLILGIRQIGINGEERKDYKAKYQKQLNNLKQKKK